MASSRDYRLPLGIATLCLSITAAAGEPSRELEQWAGEARPGDLTPVIVTLHAGTDRPRLADLLEGERRSIRRRVVASRLQARFGSDSDELIDSLRARGVQDVRKLWLINGIALMATPSLIDELAGDPRTIQIRPDFTLFAPLPMAGEPTPVEWNIAVLGVPQVWQLGYLGGSVVVGILDTGVDGTHPELAAAWRGGTNSWFDPYGEHSTPYDRTGHGTQALGLIVGGSASGTSIGIAPQARWIAAKIFDDSGSASESAIHEAFQWVLDPDGDPDTDDAPDVVSNSWGISDAGVCNTLFQPDIEALKAADIAVVFSAGNSGPFPETGVSPANNPGVFSVGATSEDGLVADFSSRGPSTCDGGLLPLVVAPANGVLTTDLALGGLAPYVQVSGTSFAAPQVAGIMALLRDAVPPVSVAELEAALIGTAIDAADPGPDQDSGYGLVNAAAALDALSFPEDLDGDGFSSFVDCDDSDGSIYPGAPERHSDGVDQDCNGYDMTLKVRQAVYSHDGTSLYLRVTSALGEAAQLEVVDVGPLDYREVRGDWFLTEGAVDGYASPTIVVRGVEGEIAVTPRHPTPRRE